MTTRRGKQRQNKLFRTIYKGAGNKIELVVKSIGLRKKVLNKVSYHRSHYLVEGIPAKPFIAEQVTRDPQYSDSTTIAGLEHGMQRTTIGPSYPIPAIAPTARPPLPASKTARQAMTSGTGRLAPAPPRGPTPPPPRVPMPPPPPQVPRSGDRPHLNPNFALEVGPQIPMPLPQVSKRHLHLPQSRELCYT